MVRLFAQFRVAAAALIVGLALVLASGPHAMAGVPCGVPSAIEQIHHPIDHPGLPDTAKIGCCADMIQCCMAAPTEPAGESTGPACFANVWSTLAEQPVSGFDPPVNRRPPRGLA